MCRRFTDIIWDVLQILLPKSGERAGEYKPSLRGAAGSAVAFAGLSLRVAGGCLMPGTEDEKIALLAALKAKRGRLQLPKRMAEAIRDLAFNTLDITSIEELDGYGSDGIEAMIGEIYEDPAASMVRNAKGFFAADPAAVAEAASSSSKKSTRAENAKRGGKALKFADSDDDDGSVFGDSFAVKNREGAQAELERDMARMRLTEEQITALHRSVFLGQVVTPDEVEGVPYGQDCGHTDWARKVRKSEVEPLPDLLKKKNYGHAKEHLVALIREYNSIGATQEVTIITTFVTMAEEMFGDDLVGLCKYIEAYLKLYKGRAFPKEVDLRLVVKSLRSTGVSAVAADVKSLQSDVRSLKSKMETVESKVGNVTSLQTKIGRLEDKVNRGRQSGDPSNDGEGGREAKKCSYCQETGHFYRNCPARKADEAAKAKKEEEQE